VDYSKITDCLYIGRPPLPEDYPLLHDLGVRLVINMRAMHGPQFDPQNPPIPALWLRTFDSPLMPTPLRALQHGVMAALHTIAEGGSVYAHCAHGKHRGPAILIAQGHPPANAMELIKNQRDSADPYIWYIRRWIERFAATWDEPAALPASCD